MKAKKVIILALAAGLGVAGALALLTHPSGAKGAALAAREEAMELLGKSIARLRPGDPVMVLANPFVPSSGYLNEKSQFERAGLEGLRRGLSRHSRLEVVVPDIRPGYLADPQSIMIPPDCRTPLSFVVQPASLDRLAREHRECRVIVSLIGLPVGVDELSLWEEGDPRCFALLLPDLRTLGPPEAAVAAFQRGKLLTAVVHDSSSGAPLIVTRENVEEVLQHQPKALGY